MTKRERKYHTVKELNRKGISVRTRRFKAPRKTFSMEDLESTFCMCIPNYCVDKDGKVIPPSDGSKPHNKFIFGKWENGKMIYDDEPRTA